MNREETLALWQQGKDAWNAWAHQMLARRAEMERDGTWATTRDFGEEKSGNEVTAAWMREATADFGGQVFKTRADFAHSLFPGFARFDETGFGQGADYNRATFSGNAGFDSARFSGNARFDWATFSGNARFDSATFSGDARFDWATFSGNPGFTRATFSGNARFESARFSGDARFETATFSGYAGFDWATFSDGAGFDSATFSGDAGFDSATFSGNAGFDSATFSGNAGFTRATFSGNARFDRASFKGRTSLSRATFRRLASFSAAQGESAFTLEGASFAEVPDFIQAHFAEAPRLDNSHICPQLIEPRRFWGPLITRVKGDGNRSARYRALKRLAIDGHDHVREQEYFAGELKSLRGCPDRLLPNPLNWFRRDESGRRRAVWPGGARYWFGLGYQLLSDFGRSMLRPLGWWVLAVAGFAWGYLAFARVGDQCAVGPGTPWSAALGLSIRKALPFAGIASSEKLNQIYACLYGIHGKPDQTGPGAELMPGFTPVIPDAVDYLGMGQLVLSILLLFLFLLAVRSHFRIR